MRYISLFSGIEATTVAWKPLGFEAVAFSEIERFPNAVLAHHYQEVPNLGDITQIDWSKYCEAADIVVGGSPCQSFSVAGLRKGLDDPRGNLMLEYFRAVDCVAPKWTVWENVPGVLSSNGGADFECFLQGLEELGYSTCWRILDAQFFGVAQRRRRVFVVGYLGDWRPPASVLFERTSLYGDTAPSRNTRETFAGSLKASTAYAIAGNTIDRKIENGGNGTGFSEDICYTLTSTDRHAVAGFAYHVSEKAHGLAYKVEQSPTITATHPPAICMADDTANAAIDTELSGTLKVGGMPPAVKHVGNIRRLTPLECERLQGFPDNYTNIPSATDSARYKALGNSMAVPVMRWIGEGLKTVEEYLKG